MATVIAYDPTEAPCLGCSAPLLYEVIVEPYSAPEIIPPSGAVAYRGGHLCASCANVVNSLLHERRAHPFRSKGLRRPRVSSTARLCAVDGCAAEGKAHDCPADGASHGHGRIHYSYCGTELKFREGEWHLICDEHYAVCVEARRALEARP